jgi:hypothetical protein
VNTGDSCGGIGYANFRCIRVKKAIWLLYARITGSHGEPCIKILFILALCEIKNLRQEYSIVKYRRRGEVSEVVAGSIGHLRPVLRAIHALDMNGAMAEVTA